MSVEIEKPPTVQAAPWRRWARVHLLSPYLREIPLEEKTLDLACGWGFYFEINPGAYGIEIDEACVRHLQAQGKQVVRGSLLEPFPFQENFFDNCVSHDVLEHFDFADIPKIFAQVNRVLKPGGLFMNVVPNRKGYDFGVKEDVGHRHFITPEEIRQVAEDNGFEFEGAYPSPLPAVAERFFAHNKWVTRCRKRRALPN